MQDEPAGLTLTQLPPSPEEKDSSTVSRSGNQPNRTDGQPSCFTPDYSHLNPERAFPDFDRGRFCSPRSIRDLQHRRDIQQHLKSQQDAFSPAVSPPPPPGLFSHLPQRQLFSARNDPGAADPRGSPLEEAEADAASPSPTFVNPHTIQMDSPIAHHINNGNGSSSTGNMLSGGLGAAFPNLPSQEMQSANGGSSSPSLPGFGTPWSVQTSSSPPPAPNSINPIHPIHANAINQMPNADSDNSFYPGIPSSINPAFFQSYSPVSANPCAGINVQGYSGPFSPQINVHQQQSRRSPVSPQMHPQQGAFLQQRNNYNQHQVSCYRAGEIPWRGQEIVDNSFISPIPTSMSLTGPETHRKPTPFNLFESRSEVSPYWSEGHHLDAFRSGSILWHCRDKT